MSSQVTRRHSRLFSEESNLVLVMHLDQSYTRMPLQTNVPLVPLGWQAKAPAPRHASTVCTKWRRRFRLRTQLTQRFTPLRLFAQTRFQYLAAWIARQRLTADYHVLRDLEIGQMLLKELADLARLRFRSG